MTNRRLVPVRATLVALAALILQVSFVADLRIAGAIGDLMLVAVVAAGLTGGPDRGVAYGFALGVLYTEPVLVHEPMMPPTQGH